MSAMEKKRAENLKQADEAYQKAVKLSAQQLHALRPNCEHRLRMASSTL